jgi:endonuclease YncB( thermonuclease family)
MKRRKDWTASAIVTSITDGDTFKCRINLLENRGVLDEGLIDLGWHLFLETHLDLNPIATIQRHGINLYIETSVRLHNVNAPEIQTFEGVKAANFLKLLLSEGTMVQLKSKRLDKYGRSQAEVTLPDGRDVGTIMVTTGNAFITGEGGIPLKQNAQPGNLPGLDAPRGYPIGD